jgi:hypothetical protein
MTYRRYIVEELAQESNNVIDVLVSLHKPESLAPCQLTDYIKGEELQPLTEVAALASLRKHVLCLVKPVCECRADERLVVDERAHGECVVDASAVLCVEVFVGGGEEGEKRCSLGHGTLDRVEVRLAKLVIVQQTYLHVHTL